MDAKHRPKAPIKWSDQEDDDDDTPSAPTLPTTKTRTSDSKSAPLSASARDETAASAASAAVVKLEQQQKEDCDDDDGKGAIVHPNVFVLWSGEGLEAVSAYVRNHTKLPTFVRPRYESSTGKTVPNQYVAVVAEHVAQLMRSQIAAAQKSAQLAAAAAPASVSESEEKDTKDSGGKVGRVGGVKRSVKCVLSRVAPLRLEAQYDLPNVSTHYSDSFFIRVPNEMPSKPVRKHLEQFFDMLRGRGLVETGQFSMDIPTLRGGKHHRRQCVVSFYTKERAERQKERDPTNHTIKTTGKVSEANLPFIRYLLHNYTWPDTMPIIDTTSSTPKDDKTPTTTPEPPSYFIACDWNAKKYSRPPKRH